eukprot:Rmarinus@m.4210
MSSDALRVFVAFAALFVTVSALPIDMALSKEGTGYVPIYVMMPLGLVSIDGHLHDPDQFRSWMYKLREADVDGIMLDVWWGIVERDGPGLYNWAGYRQIVDIVEEADLEMQMVLSFHQCGGNVNDDCYIPLPDWVRAAGEYTDIYYEDKYGNQNPEYLSLGVDDLRLFNGRTPIEMYTDFMISLTEEFQEELGTTIVEWMVGLGAAGELRYSSYPLAHWNFPGVGEFQCYDDSMLSDLASAAAAIGKPEWGHPPKNTGSYSMMPQDVPFFNDYGCWAEEGSSMCDVDESSRIDCGYVGISEEQCTSRGCCWQESFAAGVPWCFQQEGYECDHWDSPYGDFFLSWYSGKLIEHGSKILSIANTLAEPFAVHTAAKIAGIHWWYLTNSHGPELTAGYYNTVHRDGYADFATMFKAENAVFDFTCFEMRNHEQPEGCAPEELVQQTKAAGAAAGVKYAGENALYRYDRAAYEQIENNSRNYRNGSPINAFTYLRLDDNVLGYGFEEFRAFVWNMHHLYT